MDPHKIYWSGLRRSVSCQLIAVSVMALAAPVAGQVGLPAQAPDKAEDRLDAQRCLTGAIVHEAGMEPLAGQQAVAQVVLNRVMAVGYPKTICGVVFQGSTRSTGCQFSFTCDGSLQRRIPAPRFASAEIVAQSALDGALPDRVGSATHYHAHYVSPPWARRLNRIGRIGAHIFYGSKHIDALPSTISQALAANRQAGPQPLSKLDFSPWGLGVPVRSDGEPGTPGLD